MTKTVYRKADGARSPTFAWPAELSAAPGIRQRRRGPQTCNFAHRSLACTLHQGRSVDHLRCALPNASTGSLDATLSGTRFVRERLILLCKVFALIDVSYLALFTLGVKLDTGESYFSLLTQSFSLESLGEYVLFALIYLACRAFGASLRACACSMPVRSWPRSFGTRAACHRSR